MSITTNFSAIEAAVKRLRNRISALKKMGASLQARTLSAEALLWDYMATDRCVCEGRPESMCRRCLAKKILGVVE